MRLAAWIAVAGCLAAGCSSAPASPASKVQLTPAEIALLTSSDQAGGAATELNNGVETLVQRCMQAKGLVYYPALQTAADHGGPAPLPGVPQAHIGLPAREAGGYGFYAAALATAASPAGRDKPGGTTPEGQYVASLPAAAQARYLAVLAAPDGRRVSVTFPGGVTTSLPVGGCRGEAERRIYGSIANELQATAGASLQTNQLFSAVTADPAFASVVARWSSRMAGRGLHYATPEILWNSLATQVGRSPTPAMRDLEVRVSVADYRCAAAVSLLPTVRSLLYKHARYLSSSLAGNLARIIQIDASALKAVRALGVGR